MRYCGRWPTRADARCWRPWPDGEATAGDSSPCSRSPARVCPDTCGCCARPVWWTSASRRSGASTACARNLSPRSIPGWVDTGPCGSSSWTPCTPRSLEESANEGVPDDRRRRSPYQRPGQAAFRRWNRRRSHSRTAMTPTSTICGPPSPSRAAWRAGTARSRVTCAAAGSSAPVARSRRLRAVGRVEVCEPPRRLQVMIQGDRRVRAARSRCAALRPDHRGDHWPPTPVRPSSSSKSAACPWTRSPSTGRDGRSTQRIWPPTSPGGPAVTEARWDELVPPYLELAARLS